MAVRNLVHMNIFRTSKIVKLLESLLIMLTVLKARKQSEEKNVQADTVWDYHSAAFGLYM